jgi:hypothetical protein
LWLIDYNQLRSHPEHIGDRGGDDILLLLVTMRLAAGA